MTVKELYEYCKKKGAENYTVASAGIRRGYSVTEKDIEIISDEQRQGGVGGEVWL